MKLDHSKIGGCIKRVRHNSPFRNVPYSNGDIPVREIAVRLRPYPYMRILLDETFVLIAWGNLKNIEWWP